MTKTVPASLSALYAATADATKRKKWFPKGAFKQSSQTRNKYFRGAWKKGALPSAGYEAALSVAYPDPSAPAFSVKFSAKLSDAAVAALHKSVASYLKVLSGVSVAQLRALFAALPELMENFRENVSADVAADPELRRRLPAAYINAYLRLK